MVSSRSSQAAGQAGPWTGACRPHDASGAWEVLVRLR
jgi:hypothetical protein